MDLVLNKGGILFLSKMKPGSVVDPSGRFEKIDETLTVHSNVICFKAYDRENGLEVSWFEIDCLTLTEQQKESLESRAKTVKNFKFSSLLSVFTYWFNPQRTVFYLITENVNCKSIYSHIKGENQPQRPKTIQKWVTSVLQTLKFLHTQNPPFTHYRVELASVFIKSSSKLVKIMPPLLNPYMLKSETHELKLRFNTPPEAIFNKVITKSDIWSLGIAVLYCVTMEQPYLECKTPLELLFKLRNFQPPASLEKLTDPHLKDFIRSCLLPTDQRPSATELLNHPFLTQSYEQTSSDAKLPANFEILIRETPAPMASTGTIAGATNIQLNRTERAFISTPFLFDDTLKDKK